MKTSFNKKKLIQNYIIWTKNVADFFLGEKRLFETNLHRISLVKFLQMDFLSKLDGTNLYEISLVILVSSSLLLNCHFDNPFETHESISNSTLYFPFFRIIYRSNKDAPTTVYDLIDFGHS